MVLFPAAREAQAAPPPQSVGQGILSHNISFTKAFTCLQARFGGTESWWGVSLDCTGQPLPIILPQGSEAHKGLGEGPGG